MRHEIKKPSSIRKPKLSISQSKKLNHLQQKIVKKSSSSVFTPFTENDAVSEKESGQISSISASSDDNRSSVEHPEVPAGVSSVSDDFSPNQDPFSVSGESSIVSLEHFISPLSARSGSVESSPLSSTTTAEMTPASSTITTEAAEVFVTSDEATTAKMTTSETETLVKLRESIFQLWDELAKMETQEWYGLNEERGMVANLFSRKEMFLLLSFVLVTLAVLTCFFLFIDVQSFPPPT